MRQVCFHGSLLGHEVELITEEASGVSGNAVRSVASLLGEVKKMSGIFGENIYIYILYAM